MSTDLEAIGAAATAYYRGGLSITKAAALALEDALTAQTITYTELCGQVRLRGALWGYCNYLVPPPHQETTYETLGELAKRLTPNATLLVAACAKVIIRVNLVRRLLKREKIAPQMTGSHIVLMSQAAAGYLTLREIGLWCARASQDEVEPALRAALDRGEMTYESLYHELYAAVKTSTLNSIVFRPGTDLQENIVWAMSACARTNHRLLLEIAATALNMYFIAMVNWDDEDDYLPRPSGRVPRWRKRR